MLTLSAFLWTLLVAVLPLPAEGPAIANALLFGAPLAIALTWAGCLGGAGISFELARRGGRPAAQRWMRPGQLARLDRVALGAGSLGLLGLRLLPFASFTGLNWAAGLASVDRRTFYWTTAVGIVPGCVAFTWLAQRGATVLPNAALPTVGAALLAIAALRWMGVNIPFRSWVASASPFALRFRVGALGGVLLAVGLFLAAPERSGNATPLASAHCPVDAVAGERYACCDAQQAAGRG